MERYAQILAALGSPQRLSIIQLLIQSEDRGLPVGEVQSRLGIPASTLSHHLEKLRQEGLVEIRRDRQWVWHRVRLDAIGDLVSFLCLTCYRPEQLAALIHQIRSRCAAEADRLPETSRESASPPRGAQHANT